MKPTHIVKIKDIVDYIQSSEKVNIDKITLQFVTNNGGCEYDAHLSNSKDSYIVMVAGYNINFLHNELDEVKPIKPKKKMRPYTDEEWREWFLNDGALIHNETGVIWKPISMRKDISFFEYSEDGDRDRPVWMSKEKVLERYIDRNGNKFEKEVE